MTSLRSLPPIVSISVLAACVATSPAVFAQGALTPPGGPTPSMKSLAEIDASITAMGAKAEARIPVDTLPGDATAMHIISAPGSYFLRGHLTSPADNVGAIRVNAPGVVIDLNGFSLLGTGVNSAANAISANGIVKRFIVRNGTISGWKYGIAGGSYSLVEDLVIEAMSAVGINMGENSMVRNVVVLNVGLTGIHARQVESCRVRNVMNTTGAAAGIIADIARSCEVESVFATVTGEAFGIDAQAVESCRVNGVHSTQKAWGIRGSLASSGWARDCDVSAVEGTASATSVCGIASELVNTCNVTQIEGGDLTHGIQAVRVEACFVRWVASADTGATIYGIAADNVFRSRVDDLHGSPLLAYGIGGTVLVDNHVSAIEPTVGSSYGLRVDAGGQARGNTIISVNSIGIAAGSSVLIARNTLRDIGTGFGVGIFVSNTNCRVENNSIEGSSGCDYGIRVTGTKNLLIGNRCAGSFGGGSTGATGVDSAEFNIVASNRFGPIVSTFSASGEITVLNPWANFSD